MPEDDQNMTIIIFN